jgi:branched-chain amino acid transport system substrate-binding protein
MDHAVKQAVDVVNAQGGIKSLGGRPLEAVDGDTQSDPDVSAVVAQRLMDGGVVALIGTYPSEATLSVAEMAERSRVPLIVDASSADAITQQGYRYTFRIQPNETVLGIYGARYLKEVSSASGQSVRNIAYFHESSDFAMNVFAGFKGEAARQGMNIAHDVSYDASTTDLSIPAAKALSDNPQIIAVTGEFPDGVALIKSLAGMQPSTQAIWGVADGGFATPEFLAAVQSDGNYVFDANSGYNASSKALQDLRTTYKQHSGDDMPAEAVYAFQAVLLLADALDRAASVEGSAVRDALVTTYLPTDLIPMVGPIKFDIRGDNLSAAPVVVQVQQGQIQQVYPPEVAQTPPVFPAVPWS